MIERIIEFWDRKTPVSSFWTKSGDNFLYPGEVAAFVNYFKDKLDQMCRQNRKRAAKSVLRFMWRKDKKLETLDKVFKFATFDKQNFCRERKTEQVLRKIFPVCELVTEFCPQVKKK